jgi:hypothetical protein
LDRFPHEGKPALGVNDELRGLLTAALMAPAMRKKSAPPERNEKSGAESKIKAHKDTTSAPPEGNPWGRPPIARKYALASRNMRLPRVMRINKSYEGAGYLLLKIKGD